MTTRKKTNKTMTPKEFEALLERNDWTRKKTNKTMTPKEFEALLERNDWKRTDCIYFDNSTNSKTVVINWGGGSRTSTCEGIAITYSEGCSCNDNDPDTLVIWDHSPSTKAWEITGVSIEDDGVAWESSAIVDLISQKLRWSEFDTIDYTDTIKGIGTA